MTEKPHGSKRSVLVIAVALVVVIAVAILLYQRLSPTGTPAAAPASASRPAASTPASTQSSVQKLPQATVADSAGASVELASIGEGKPMVVNVWATWCPNCVDEMDDWQQLYQAHGDKVSFVILDATGTRGETVDRARAYIDQHGYGFPVYFDTADSARTGLGITALPTTLLVNPDGTIAQVVLGRIDAQAMDQQLRALAGE